MFMKSLVVFVTAISLLVPVLMATPGQTYKDTDMVSVVLTVKTAKELISSLSAKTIPSAATSKAALGSLLSALSPAPYVPPPGAPAGGIPILSPATGLPVLDPATGLPTYYPNPRK